MDKKKMVYIVLGSLGALAVIIVALAIFVPRGGEEPVNNGPAANVDTDLTDGDKAEIKASTEKFITELGNYGWYPDSIRNPGNVKVDTVDNFFATQDHTTPEDSRESLRLLANSTEFDSSINDAAYAIPFSVESAITDAITIPDRPQAEGNQTVVTVSVPVSSTLSYLSFSTSHMGDDGNFVDSVVTIQVKKFEGELTLKFHKEASGWYVSDFSDTVGIFATDEFFIVNGDLQVNATPVSEESLVVN